MKAIVRHTYGSPDVLRLEEVEKPTPGDDEVLIRVHAAALNAADWRFLRGKPFLLRFASGLLKPKIKILGADVAGVVETVGGKVTQFQPGDEVFGDISECSWGGFAEYARASEEAFALKPAGLTFEQAAATPFAAVTALQGLRDNGNIQSGQKVLVNGASGGVGTFAVQIAKSFGAEVTGVSSTTNLDMVRSIGADHVIDYTQEDFTERGHRYDLILDIAASRSKSDYERALSPEGIVVVVGGSIARILQASMTGGGRMVTFEAKPSQKDLVFVKELLEGGKISPVIDRSYPLSEVPDAIRYLEEGHARGKVVISLGLSN